MLMLRAVALSYLAAVALMAERCIAPEKVERMRAQLRDGDPGFPGASSDRGRLALPISLFLIGIGYILMVAGPLISGRLAPLLAGGSVSSAGTLPTAASAGIALLGAAAMVLVLAQLVRDVERNPYGAIAPVLAVFSAYLLTSVRAQLPLPAWAGEHLGLFVLTLALVGGALIGREPFVARLFGWALAILPFGACAAMVVARRQGEPLEAVLTIDGSLRTYLTLLGLSSFALAFAGTVSRSLTRAAEQAAALAMPQVRMPDPAYAGQPLHASQQLPRINVQPMRAPIALGRPHPRAPVLGQRPAPQPYGQAQRPMHHEAPADAGFDDDLAVQLMRRRSGGRALVIGLAVLAGLAVAGYFAYRTTTPQGASTVELKATPLPVAAPAPVQAPAIVTEPLREPTVEQVAPSAAPEPPAPVAEERARSAEVETRSERRSARAEKRRRAADAKESQAAKQSDAKAKSVAVGAREKDDKGARAAASDSDEGDASAPPVSAKGRGAARVAEKPAAKPVVEKAPSAPAKPAEPTQNERDLDLDELVNKALKSTNGVSAADDPLLGL